MQGCWLEVCWGAGVLARGVLGCRGAVGKYREVQGCSEKRGTKEEEQKEDLGPFQFQQNPVVTNSSGGPTPANPSTDTDKSIKQSHTNTIENHENH